MRRLATTAQMKELDRTAIQDRGIPSLELMETAAKAVAETVLELLEDQGKAARAVGIIGGADPGMPEVQAQMEELRAIVESKNTDPAPRVAIFCGPGNNGGDGIAAARLLRKEGVSVRAFLVGNRSKMTPDAKAMEERLLDAGGRLEDYLPGDKLQWGWLTTCDCMIDAIFGVWLQRPVEGAFLSAIQQMNRCAHIHCPVVACDVPSGVNGDTGEILGDAVHAKVTVTFSCAKPGLYLGEGGPCAGQVRVVDIGIPFGLISQQIWRRPEPVSAMDGGTYVLPRRPRTAHKGEFGKVFILAGAQGYTGAPVLASRAAVRTGAGLVYLGVPREIYPIVAVKCDEAMPFPLSEDYEEILEKARGCNTALIGPGLGRTPKTEELVHRLLTDLDLPVVLDADGINALSGHIDILDRRSAPTVLTPHDGEFQRLTGCEPPLRDRLTAAREFAKAHHCVLVLKGHGTVTAAPDGETWICGAGNPGMAKGGSGDVLAGVLASLLGQKHLKGPYTSLAEMVAVGVYYHAQAGDRCAQRLGEYGMTPSDMVEALPEILLEHEDRER